MTSEKGHCIVLHRGISNAGDFLIRDRTLALVSQFRPDLPIVIGRAWEPLRGQFDYDVLASARAILVCGGPGYQAGMYPGLYPLVPLDQMKVPVVLLSLGTYALQDPSGRLRLDDCSMRFLRHVQANGGRLGARDRLTQRFLTGHGLETFMVGDPAWYDEAWLDRVDYGLTGTGIAFTPPANPLFHAQGLRLLETLAGTAGAENVTVVFHRGAQRTFTDACDRLRVPFVDIAGSASGLRVFDDVGCHVGYRVHAHLYCLSHTTPSYLVAEDSRGLGVHETLGTLGVDGTAAGPGMIATRTWGAMPRIGSQRSPITRQLGLAASRAARLADVGAMVLGQFEADKQQAFERHVRAKGKILATLPVMVRMLESIP